MKNEQLKKILFLCLEEAAGSESNDFTNDFQAFLSKVYPEEVNNLTRIRNNGQQREKGIKIKKSTQMIKAFADLGYKNLDL